jgi:type I restriction enzyme S subunit
MIEGPYKLPKGWRWVRLREVFKLKNGKFIRTTDLQAEGNIPVYGSNGLLGFTSNPLLREGRTIVIGRVGACGAINVVDAPCWISDNAMFVANWFIECDIEYVALALRNIDFSFFIKKGAQPSISQELIYNIFIPLPPLEEQKQIVVRIEELMDRIKEAKKLRQETKKQTELLWQSVLAETFPQPGTQLPNGWRWVRLGEIATVFSGTWGKDPSSQGNDEEAIVRVIRVSDIKETLTIDYASVPWRCVTNKEVKKLALRDGDVIVVKSSGSQAKVISGRAALFEQQSEIFLPSNFVFAVRCNAKEVAPRFLWSWLNSEPLKQVIKQMVATFTYPNLKKSDYVNLPIPLPPLEEQKRIANYLQEVHEKIKELKEVQNKTEEEIKLLEESILEKAFRGEL